MKGIKRNKTVIALAITAALSIGVVGCDSVGNKTDLEHVAAAKDFLDKNEIKSGVIELKSALQKNPNNAEARHLLGKLSLEQGNGAAAEKELKRALELGVAKEAIIASLAEALAIQGKYQEILDQIEAPANLDPVEQAKIISYRGDAWLSKRKPEKAKAEYERALEVDAESSKAKLGLAKLAVVNKESAEAEKLITEALQSSPEDSDIWLFQAELQRAKGEVVQAEESYGQAIKLNARNLMARYQRALLRIEKKEFDNAEKDIAVLKKEAPKSFQRYYAEGMLAFYEKDFQAAEAALNEALKIKGNFVEAIFFRGVSHLEQGHLVQAENDLMRIYKAYPAGIRPRQLLATALYRSKKYKEAKEVLQPVLNVRPNDTYSLKLLGNIELALGNNAQGMEHLQKLVGLEPSSAGAHAMLGFEMLKSGEREKGLFQLERANELGSGSGESDVLVVMSHIHAKEYEKANEVIERLRSKQSGARLAGNLTALLYQAKGEKSNAKKAFQDVLDEYPGDLAASRGLASMAFKNKDYKAVREIYTSVLKIHPKDLRTKLRLATLDAIENHPKEMEALLISAIEDHPKALQPRLMLSRYYTRFGQAGRAQSLLEEMEQEQGGNPQLLVALFEAQLADKRAGKALESAKELVKLVPQSAQAHFILARGYEANREVQKMQTALNRVLELEPGHIKARVAKVRLLTLEGKTEDAIKQLDMLQKEYPSDDLLSLRGWIALRNNKPQEAVTAYQEALGKRPSTKTVLALAQSIWRTGDREEAIRVLTGWSKEYPKDMQVHFLLSGFYSATGNEKLSVLELEKILEIQPNNLLALNDLAWSLRSKERVRALELAERAYALAPKSPMVVDTLAMILLESGQQERALSLLEGALDKAPGEPSLQYHLALALKANNQAGQALTKLEALLLENRGFKEKAEAEKKLEKWRLEQ